MNDGEKRRERRKQKKLRKFDTDNLTCTACGESDWRVFEAHHTAGRKFDQLTQPLCMNCHARLSDAQYDHPEAVSERPHPLECIGRFLLGLADWLTELVKKFREFGNLLIDMARTAIAAEASGSAHASA